ncbi:hypothetical protein ACT3S9_16710 [Pseudoalteromonas sp. AOP31-A2-14]|uniref:hypothetical protein n=1 Tax=unclassified Pseudoalteromonas TaxID=194690 RepID=UPI003F9CEB14
MKFFIPLFLLVNLALINGCFDNAIQSTVVIDVITPPPQKAPYNVGDDIPALAYMQHGEIYNPESVIPPQCYTKTEGTNNPCYACHQTDHNNKNRPNQMNDGSLQGDYQFSDLGLKNHWKNLFIDRTELIGKISDEQIMSWVNQDNYSRFINKLKANPDWQGEVAEVKNLAYPERAFDEQGFASDGSHWVAFNYKPFPSTFWPTNGSTGDVMIRLGKPFRELNGEYNQDVYMANLSLVEMAVKDLSTITTPDLSERLIGKDLNNDGKLTELITAISKQSHYVGDASQTELSYQLYPEDTEFLHTVRYIGVDENGQIYNAPRMKEVRYMKKHSFKSKQLLASSYYKEAKEKHFENLPQTRYLGEQGINNMFGWTINGYIENEEGELRPQHEQELAFCNGCHKTVGSTYDQSFSFPRKVEGRDGWGYINLKAMTDVPNKGEQQGEFLTYFQRVGGGDEFRQNQEMLMRWFNQDGSVNKAKVQQAKNLYELITPSKQRALKLNKAYLTIVKEQSYLFGRDATINKATNVLETVDESQAPLESDNRYVWDMQLDWHKSP